MHAGPCRICGAQDDLTGYAVREMMFGTRETFDYFQCAACGCLQMAAFPHDMSGHYPADYYAHHPRERRARGVRAAFRAMRDRHAITGRGILGGAFGRVFPYPGGRVHRWMVRGGATGPDSRILDVGCGSGELLRDMAAAGYRNVLGADPFVAADLHLPGGVRVLKRNVREVEGEFDLVMFHHALEHIPDQVGTLRAVARILAPGGTCLVRIPVVSSYAWEHYGVDWVQLDAPRHLFLHSVDSLRRVAADAGLAVAAVEYDSTELQFVGSELYRRDIPLCEAAGVFSRREIRAFRKRADELNRAGRGDSAAFYLRGND
ncbi:MAG: class I SAM-dependent methyltransferase [Gemmatimonadota bacterium]